MEYLHIGGLLERFKKSLFRHDGLKKSVIDVVLSQTGILLEEKSITIKGTQIRIDQKPQYKNEIFIKKEKILEILKNKIGEHIVSDIR